MGSENEHLYAGCIQLLSSIPGFVGNYMRAAFYWAVCTDVSWKARFMYGSWLSHRQNVLRAGAMIGHYAFVGYAEIGENAIIGARVSIVSGLYQHGRPSERVSQQELTEENTVIKIGRNSWIGQDVTLLANVGENCTVGAGSVVLRDVSDNTTVLGNPARKVNL